MSDVPEYFEYIASDGEKSGMHPFRYLHEERLFTIGSTTFAVTEFDPYEYHAIDAGLDDKGIPVNEMPEHPALLPVFGSVLGGPKLHNLLRSKPTEIKNTYKVMVDVFAQFVSLDADMQKETRSHMGFASGITEHGNLRLQVLGECACLGPDPMGLFVQGQYEAGFAEYSLHNADIQAQRTSLYAGFGHIARLAAEQ